MDIMSIIIIKLHRGGFIHFFWKKQYDGNILWTFVVEISYGDLLWGSCSDMNLGYTWVWVPKNGNGI